MRWKKY